MAIGQSFWFLGMGDGELLILNSQFSILNSQFSILNSQFSILNSQFPNLFIVQ
ncbi:MAG: hypothetical protein F6K31_11980 [Symploca sp. SIO2G7]|nr:hypothetical protein [Symploca sp. SIO2G7]